MNTRDMNICEYSAALSSASPIPGGGGVSAVAGMLGACLGQMVCNLTIGKKKYKEHEKQIEEIKERLSEKEKLLIELSDGDAKAFLPLSKAYSLPANTEEEKKIKKETMEPLLNNAAQVPLDIMNAAYSMLDDMDYIRRYGSTLAVSDVGVAVQLIRAAVLGAYMNVKINTGFMEDKTKANKLDERALDIKEKTIIACDAIYKDVLEIMR